MSCGWSCSGDRSRSSPAAASGIGLALAERFASAGLDVVLADVEHDALAAAADAVGARGASRR